MAPLAQGLIAQGVYCRLDVVINQYFAIGDNFNGFDLRSTMRFPQDDGYYRRSWLGLPWLAGKDFRLNFLILPGQ